MGSTSGSTSSYDFLCGTLPVSSVHTLCTATAHASRTHTRHTAYAHALQLPIADDCGNPGCMDTTAMNYNQLADAEPDTSTQADLLCIPTIFGCTYKVSAN